MGKKSSTYTEVDPRVGEAMNRQADLAQQSSDFNLNTAMPYMMNATTQANEIQDALGNFGREQAIYLRDRTRATTDKQNERAEASWNDFENIGAPADKWLSADARDYNEGAERERQIESAIADLTMGYAQGRKLAAQQYNQQGIDPTSGRYQGGFRQIADDEANNKAQARLAAERAAKELGWNKKLTAVNIGQNYLNRSIDYANQSNNTISAGMGQVLSALGSASNSAQTRLSNLSNMYNSYNSNLSSLMNQNQSIFNAGMGVSNTNLNQSISNAQNAAATASGYGSAFGSIAGMASNLAVNKMNTGSWTGK